LQGMKIFGELSECSSDVLKCSSFHEELLELISGMLIEDTREYTLAQGSASEASVSDCCEAIHLIRVVPEISSIPLNNCVAFIHLSIIILHFISAALVSVRICTLPL